jgi:hypothetical protein
VNRPPSLAPAAVAGLAASGLAVALTVALASCSGADGPAASAAAASASAAVCGTTLKLWETGTSVGADFTQLPQYLTNAVSDVSANPVSPSQDQQDASSLQLIAGDLQGHPIPSCAGTTAAAYYAQLISDLKNDATALQKATSTSSYNTVNGYDTTIGNDANNLNQYLVLAGYPTPGT